MRVSLFFLLFLLGSNLLFAQEEDNLILSDSIPTTDMHKAALKPSKMGFYSAIVPGLGQWNAKYSYIKIPVIYAGLGTTTYFYIKNNDKYQEYRSLYKQKKIDDAATEFSFDYLEKAQKLHKKQRDLSMLLIAGTYILQVVWASVDAHLEYHNTNSDLSFSPSIIQDSILGKSSLGAGFTLNF